MPIGLEDILVNNAVGFTIASARDNNVRGIYWVASTGARDSIGNASLSTSDLRSQYTICVVAGDIYIYTSSSIADVDWEDATNWTQIATGDLAALSASLTTEIADRIAGDAAINTTVSNLTTTVNGNTNSISTNASGISGNTTGISNNATSISTNASAIAQNASDLATEISTTNTEISSIQSTVNSNSTSIGTNSTNIATNVSAIATNVTDIATNTTGIATNLSSIQSNDTDIASLQTSVGTNTADISTNVTDISNNTGSITTNASGIATNAADISGNDTNISTNTTNIATNAASITTLDGQVVKKTDSIDELNDVDTTTAVPADGEVLKWNGSNWVPGEGGGVVRVEVKNGTVTDFSKGDAVYVSGTATSGKPEIELADNNGTGTYPAIGLLEDDITAGDEGFVVVSGSIFNLNTSSFSAGDSLYVDSTPGAVVNTRPNGATTEVQKVALVKKSHTTSGSVIVMGAGRTNDVPNISNGNFWLGDGNGVAQEQSFDTSVGGATQVSANTTKLAGIETGATADQTDAEIKTAYENNANTNEFSDAEQTKLAGINAGAEVNPTNTDGLNEGSTNLYYTEARVSANTAVAANTAKDTFPGFGTTGGTALEGDTTLLELGTTSSTALAGDTTTITSGQASAITANTAKTGITSGQASAITANTAKVTFPGFGTSGGTALEGDTALLQLGTTSSTALAGNTTTITSGQASAITANTAKTSFPGFGTTSGTALEGDTSLFSGAYADLTGKPSLNELDGQSVEYITRSSAYGNNTWEGEVIKFGSDTLVQNKFYVHTSLGWVAADADTENKTKGLFGIALGTSSATDGILVKGIHSSNAHAFSAGDTLYVGTTEGSVTTTAPSATGDFLRVVGYVLANGYIYINPSPDYIEIA